MNLASGEVAACLLVYDPIDFVDQPWVSSWKSSYLVEKQKLHQQLSGRKLQIRMYQWQYKKDKIYFQVMKISTCGSSTSNLMKRGLGIEGSFIRVQVLILFPLVPCSCIVSWEKNLTKNLNIYIFFFYELEFAPKSCAFYTKLASTSKITGR